MLKIGSKIREEMASLTKEQKLAAIADVPELSADDPIYKRGFAIGGMRLSDSSRNTAGTASPQSKDSSPGQKGSSTNLPDEDQIHRHNRHGHGLKEKFGDRYNQGPSPQSESTTRKKK